MPIYEYKVEVVNSEIASDTEKMQDYLNKRGTEGWRLIDKMVSIKRNPNLTALSNVGIQSEMVMFFEKELIN